MAESQRQATGGELLTVAYRIRPVYNVREGETRMVIRIEPLRVIERLKTR